MAGHGAESAAEPSASRSRLQSTRPAGRVAELGSLASQNVSTSRRIQKSVFRDFGQNEFELTSAEIEIAGSWTFDRGTYRFKGTPKAGGASVEDHGKYLLILKRQSDGSWKVSSAVRDFSNFSNAPSSSAAETKRKN